MPHASSTVVQHAGAPDRRHPQRRAGRPRRRGIALAGVAPEYAFGEVAPEAFWDAVLHDFRWVVDGGIVESPFYGVLNACRVLQQRVARPFCRRARTRLPSGRSSGSRSSIARSSLERWSASGRQRRVRKRSAVRAATPGTPTHCGRSPRSPARSRGGAPLQFRVTRASVGPVTAAMAAVSAPPLEGATGSWLVPRRFEHKHRDSRHCHPGRRRRAKPTPDRSPHRWSAHGKRREGGHLQSESELASPQPPFDPLGLRRCEI